MKTNFNGFALQLEELAEVARGFEKNNYDMGWTFIKGALYAMSNQVDKKVEEVTEPEELKITIVDNGKDVNEIAKELSVIIDKSNIRRNGHE
ncbi:MAG: hypothetical protein ACRDB9_07660 [Cetobacterium sp.]